MAGHTDNAVLLQAPLDVVWRLTNDVESWPHLFSEYAAVEVLERRGNTVRFRLTMHPDEQGNKWSWVSERTTDYQSRTTRAHRVEPGWFKYMSLFGEYVPTDSGVRMRWVQDFEMKSGAPVDDAAMTQRLNRNTARQMQRIKELAESVAVRGE